MYQDLKFGARMLVRSPAFTLVTALPPALGIGANTAVSSLVNAVLLRPIPAHEASELASVFTTDQRDPDNLPLSHLDYKDLRDQNQVFTDMAAFTVCAGELEHARGSIR
ncbi:MAG TPA: hypothetical protein VM364_06905 [Vicinamibacterales bacterium]|nr:hypothetical protein [Vicinamibacterales bacterium]